MADDPNYWNLTYDESHCPTRTITSWTDFVAATTAYASTGMPFAFRGEGDSSWRLTPSLLRRVPSMRGHDLLVAENQAMSTFMQQAHLHLASEHLPQKGELEFELEWWSLMQHFGAPTRLLDWTLSPFVAAYFAVEQMPASDGAVSVVSVYGVQSAFNDRFRKIGAGIADVRPNMFKPDAPDYGVFFWNQGRRRSARSVAQQGLVSVASQVATRHGEILNGATHGTVPTIYNRLREHATYPAERWIFPAAIKDDILRALRTANIAAHSLFPGLDGVGRSAAEVVRIGATWDQQKEQAS